MKTYQDHLKSFLNPKPAHSCKSASAIFPAFFSSHVKTKLCFVHYWKLKRGIKKLTCQVSIRDSHGKLVLTQSYEIEKVKAYEVDLSKIFTSPYPFLGSIEIEFTSSKDLVFPYPGVTVVYEGKNFCSFVHSSQRIYKDSNEAKALERTSIVESGFNIYADQEKAPWITLINGPDEINNESLKLFAINKDQQILERSILVSCKPYQTLFLNLEDWKELQRHLKGEAGCLKVKLFPTSSFPRLIVGNINLKTSSLSVTHTYYDLCQSSRKEDYWNLPEFSWNPMTLMLPLREDSSYFSNIYFYPIYSPSSFWIDAEIYNSNGKKLKKIEKVKKIAPSASFQKLNFKEHLNEVEEPSLSVRLIAYPIDGEKIPSRIKVGYDMGIKNGDFSCNICTNFSPANPALENKKSAFRWAPMMPEKWEGTIWSFNDSPKIEYLKSASITCTFYRTRDEETLSFNYKIPPRGHLVITHNSQTKAFFEDSIGWCTITSDNPYISTYYFSRHSQMIGGDHGF